ncbi:MAG: GNAT family N-acetyltransferase [Prevotellaceae bacterium]|nr:GNAT family N-acetyltransferase [Prevotellaceae bacterium]
MTLRPFQPFDAQEIFGWCTTMREFCLWSADRYKDFPAKPEDMLMQYEGDNIFPFTAVVDGRVVGHIILRYPTTDKSLIRFGFIIVDKNLRSKGYGKEMLRLAIDYAINKLSAKKITLGVFNENASALNCYKSVGFKIVGEDSYPIDGEEWKGVEMECSI